MSRRILDFVEEPRGEAYHQLLDALRPYSSTVMMVVRDDLWLSGSGRALLVRLQPSLVEEKRSSSWPGTALLLDEEATVLQFAMNIAVLDELKSASAGLYDWQQPSLPEDLALIRQDGTAILSSISYERDAYLEIADEEYEALAGSIPWFAAMARPHLEE